MADALAVAAIRAFNRFYTNVIGVVDRRILRSPYSLTEVRILFEIHHDSACTARKLKSALAVDEGYMSRTIGRLTRLGLVARATPQRDARVRLLSLTPKGRRELLRLDSESAHAVAAMVDHLTGDEITELLALLSRARELLTKRRDRA